MINSSTVAIRAIRKDTPLFAKIMLTTLEVVSYLGVEMIEPSGPTMSIQVTSPVGTES